MNGVETASCDWLTTWLPVAYLAGNNLTFRPSEQFWACIWRTVGVHSDECSSLILVDRGRVTQMSNVVQVLTKEYYALQTSMEKRISELETIITEKTVRLESYEKLEHELDEVVVQAADGKYYVIEIYVNLVQAAALHGVL